MATATPPIRSIISGTNIIASGFQNVGKDMAGFAHKLEELGMGFSDIITGFGDAIKKGSEYTLGLEDSARVLQRGTILMGKNIEEFNRYSDGIRKQSFMFSDISGKAMKESQQYIAGLQATLKGFGADGSIDLTGKQFVELDKAARKMANSLTPEDYEEAKKTYDGLANSLSKNEKDALNLTAVMGKVSLTMGVSAADFNSFVDDVGRLSGLEKPDIAGLTTVMESAMKNGNLSFAESAKAFRENQDRAMGIEESYREEFYENVIKGAVMIKQSGTDFAKSAEKWGSEGEGEYEQAAVTGALTNTDQRMILSLLSQVKAGGEGGQIAGMKLEQLKLDATAKISGVNPAEMSDLRRRQASANYTPNARDLALIDQMSRGQMALGTLGGPLNWTTTEQLNTRGRLDLANKRGEQFKEQNKGIRRMNPDDIMPDAAATRGMMSSGEITTSRTTELLGEILPESLNKFNDALRDIISFVDIAASGMDTVKGLYGSMSKGVEGIGTIGFDIANIGETMTKAEWGVAKEEAFDSSTSMKALKGILAGTGLAAVLGPRLFGDKTGNMDQRGGSSLDNLLGGGKAGPDVLDNLLKGNMDKRGGSPDVLDNLLNRNTSAKMGKSSTKLDEFLKTDHSGHGSSVDEMYKLKAHSIDEILKLRGESPKGKLEIMPTARATQPPKIDTNPSKQSQNVVTSSAAHNTSGNPVVDKLQEVADILYGVEAHLRNPRVAQEPNC